MEGESSRNETKEPRRDTFALDGFILFHYPDTSFLPSLNLPPDSSSTLFME
jgi:hypothetical protein